MNDLDDLLIEPSVEWWITIHFPTTQKLVLGADIAGIPDDIRKKILAGDLIEAADRLRGYWGVAVTVSRYDNVTALPFEKE